MGVDLPDEAPDGAEYGIGVAIVAQWWSHMFRPYFSFRLTMGEINLITEFERQPTNCSTSRRIFQKSKNPTPATTCPFSPKLNANK